MSSFLGELGLQVLHEGGLILERVQQLLAGLLLLSAQGKNHAVFHVARSPIFRRHNYLPLRKCQWPRNLEAQKVAESGKAAQFSIEF